MQEKNQDAFVVDENDNNGLILNNQYIPEEVLASVLYHVDHKSLVKCMLVCKRWNYLIRNYVWRKKSETIVGRLLPADDEHLPWSLHYLICKPHGPFERNLVRNHSGSEGLKKHWRIIRNQGNKWSVEEPPVGVPGLPESETLFQEKKICFVTSFDYCSKTQTIDLIKEGLTAHIMDEVQPHIQFSEWYSARWDCRACYECSVTLLKDDDEVVVAFEFNDILEGEKQNVWLQVNHIFENYGKGVRKIRLWHQGKDRQFWYGHYGSKMAGSCIKVKIPLLQDEKKKG